ncbi:hypothetical protein [Cupriavidus lacunae]|uniref:Cyclic nucleotide-binding domain-containing protein n=1 Tax=Cupriavidus lacunae TaxID=2666307 RepID=A0A370NNM9_9BURK|nr:hypothetical protein [Cupriavidus lacunae]RDK07221.1 hypothetical protein DN412_27385 [Cupriavidus lacunae]
MKRWICLASAALLPALISACDAQPTRRDDAAATQRKPMKASITYLHLLRKTPFFTSLSTPQLRLTISHSREWEAEAGTVIAQCQDDSVTSPDIWILLDGGWRLEHDGHSYPAGHADAGKWFSARQVTGGCRLVTTEHSYVMLITRADFDDMLAQGFAFDKHLAEGYRYYREIFADVPAATRPGSSRDSDQAGLDAR